MRPAEEILQATLALTEGGEPLTRDVSEPLVRLLRQLAKDMQEDEAAEGSASKAVHPVHFMFGLMEPRDDWTAALAIARAINGGAQ